MQKHKALSPPPFLPEDLPLLTLAEQNRLIEIPGARENLFSGGPADGEERGRGGRRGGERGKDPVRVRWR